MKVLRVSFDVEGLEKGNSDLKGSGSKLESSYYLIAVCDAGFYS